MNTGKYSQGKRQREAKQVAKRTEKAEKRKQRRERDPGELEMETAEEMSGDLRSVDEVLRSLNNRENASRSATPIPCRLFVGGLSRETKDEDLRTAFSPYGVVNDAVVVVDRDTGVSRGFGFVTLENRKDGPAAIEALHNTEIDGRTIVVNVATERSR